MKAFVFSLVALLWVTGCATTPRAASPWRATPQSKEGAVVGYRAGDRVLTLRKASHYSNYRELDRREFLRHRVPVEAVSAFAGRQGKYNYDVFYVVAEDKERVIYGFTFGKFDIEWPPYVLYRIGYSGKVTAEKVL